VISSSVAIEEARARAAAVEAVALLYEAHPGLAGDPADAERMLLRLIDTMRRIDRDHPVLLPAYQSLAQLYRGRGRPRDAAAILDAALADARARRGADDAQIAALQSARDDALALAHESEP
jgi:hypothetical protein